MQATMLNPGFFFRAAGPVLGLLLVGCTPGPLYPPTQETSLIIQPAFAETDRRLQAVMVPYTRDSVNHLGVQLYTVATDNVTETLAQSGDVPGSELQGAQVRFAALKLNTRYRIRALAYLTTGTGSKISIDASSQVDVTTTSDNAPAIATLPVRLIDQSYVAQTQTGFAVTPGGLVSAGTAMLGLNFTSSVLTSVTGPEPIALDAQNNLYYALTNTHRVAKREMLTGIESFVAGTGSVGTSGDAAAATLATLDRPDGVAVDSAGNLYIADTNSNRIRKVDALTGVISHYAGSATAVSGFGGDGAAASSALLNLPRGLAFDPAGNLHIVDGNNHRIRKVDKTTNIITTVVGSGVMGFGGDAGLATGAQMQNPRGLAFDASGNLFVADQGNHRVRKVTLSSGLISTVAGSAADGFNGDGGPATSARLQTPTGVAVDSLGTLYIADRGNNRIRRVSSAGTITSIASGLNAPSGIAVTGSGRLYVSDTGNNTIRVLQ